MTPTVRCCHLSEIVPPYFELLFMRSSLKSSLWNGDQQWTDFLFVFWEEDKTGAMTIQVSGEGEWSSCGVLRSG